MSDTATPTQSPGETTLRHIDGLDFPAPGSFAIDPSHTHIGFGVRHMMVSKVRGSFKSFNGKIVVGDSLATSSVKVEIDTASIDTGEAMRDDHLRTSDFFEIEKYPKITFESSRLVPKGDERFELVGDLTIHGVTRPVALEVEQLGVVNDPWGKQRIGFTASTEVDREEFGLTYNAALEAGGVVIGKRVKLEVEVEAVREEADPA